MSGNICKYFILIPSMHRSNIGFGKSSNSWDTNCARKFLQIPEEQLKKLDSIPGWSTTKEINKKQEKSIQIVEEFSTSESKNPEETENQLAQKSALPPRKKSKTTSSDFQKLYHSAPLFSNNEVKDLTAIPISKNSNPAPNVYILEREERAAIRKSISEDISCNMSTVQSALSQSNKSSVGNTLLETTYVVPSVLDDKTNDIQVIADAQSKKTTFSPVKISTKKRTFENSETDISNLPFPEEPVPKFGGLPVFSTNSISTQVSHENFLSKKLRLLEKRFSPSKNFSLSLSQETMMANVNLKSIESQKNLSKEVSMVNEGSNSLASIRSQVNIKASLEPENEKPEDIPSSIKAVTKEKDVGSGVKMLEKEYVEVASKKSNPNVFEEESFISLPIPCGQPPPKDQPQPTEIQSFVKESIAEKSSVPSSEKSSNQVEIQDMSSVKGSTVGRKRKLKSKGENTSRKSIGKKPIVVVQYTAEQIRKMIEIMRYFQSEI